MKRFISFMMYVYQHFMKTNCFTRAASLSFTTILALVPLMLVAAYVFSFFSVSAVFQQKIQTFIFSNFVASSGSTIAFYLNSFLMRTHILSTLSSIFLVFTAFSILFSIEESLNVIWEIPFNRKWYLAILFNLFILII